MLESIDLHKSSYGDCNTRMYQPHVTSTRKWKPMKGCKEHDATEHQLDKDCDHWDTKGHRFIEG